MAQHIVKPNQNIFDIAIERYGSIEGVFDLLISNAWLTMTTQLNAGMALEYHDDFVIHESVVNTVKNNNYTPANGGRHIYMKNTDLEIIAICAVPSELNASCVSVSGNGSIAIDWGDNTELERLELTSSKTVLSHYFDNKTDERAIKFYGNCELSTFDISQLGGSLCVIRPLVVDEITCQKNSNSLKGLFLFKGTVVANLQGMDISDLSPIQDMSLQELNLLNVRFGAASVIDDYLQYIVDNYGTRRNCTVYLNTQPSEKGMAAIQTIINEPSWNQSGKWKFIINNTIYTK